jgi:hypothetical protein
LEWKVLGPHRRIVDGVIQIDHFVERILRFLFAFEDIYEQCGAASVATAARAMTMIRSLRERRGSTSSVGVLIIPPVLRVSVLGRATTRAVEPLP